MSRPALLIASAVIGLLTVPSAALAQEFRTTEAIRALFGKGYCVVRNDLPDSRKLFATPPGSKEETKLFHSLDTQVCGIFGNGLPALEADRQLMRGVIAEAVLDDAHTKKGKIYPAPAPFDNLSAEAIASLDAKGQASLAGLDFAQCVVAASPEGVNALLNKSSRGDQEKAFEQLQPYFAPCLPNGAKITFSKLVLRGLLAEAAYRTLYFTAAAGKN